MVDLINMKQLFLDFLRVLIESVTIYTDIVYQINVENLMRIVIQYTYKLQCIIPREHHIKQGDISVCYQQQTIVPSFRSTGK